MTPAPVVTPATVSQYARHLVAKASGSSRVLALRADPNWTGPGAVDVNGTQVAVRGCPSYLAVQEALLDCGRSDYLIVLTDRDAADLGEAVTSRFWHQRVEVVDPMRTVAALFAAQSVSGEVKALGSDAVDALTAHRPAAGYPAAATGVVTLGLALSSLLAAVLKVEGVDAASLMRASADLAARARWAELPASVQAGLVSWSRDELGMASQMVLRVMTSPLAVDAAAVGLATDVLYRPGAPTGALKAQGRLETHWGGYQPDQVEVRALADSALAYLAALSAQPTERLRLLDRATQVLTDVGWPRGAEESDVLPAGYRARERALAAAILGTANVAGAANPADGGAARDPSSALRALAAHTDAAGMQHASTERWRMAVRLQRWLGSADPAPTTLRAALQRQIAADAWADMAIADTFAGSPDPLCAEALRSVTDAALARRQWHDRQFAELLAAAVTADTVAAEGVVVERVLAEVVAPIAATSPVLLVVIDGMSTAVASELALDLTALGWFEAVTGGARTPVVAALPTLTRYSRTALFTGTLRDGGQADEKRGLASSLGGARLFHKDQLRSAAGDDLPDPVRTAIAASDQAHRVVAVVLNTVDDALAKADPGGTEWNVAAIEHLSALLATAGRAGRTVIVTSDHGHVVERGSQARPTPGAEARFRRDDTPAGDGEVELAGPRVVEPGGRIVAAAVADLRYGNKAAGYHGGATAAEVTIPLLVFTHDPEALAAAGWQPAPPQAPDWWYADAAGSPPTAATAAPNAAAPASATVTAAAPRPPRHVSAAQGSLFSIDVTSAAPTDADDAQPAPGAQPPAPGHETPGARLARAVVDSPIYQAKRERNQRITMDDGAVRTVVTVLADNGGRSHRDALAQALGWPAARMARGFSTLARLLNVEGYPVLRMDPDEVTVLLDIATLREQFGLGP